MYSCGTKWVFSSSGRSRPSDKGGGGGGGGGHPDPETKGGSGLKNFVLIFFDWKA